MSSAMSLASFSACCWPVSTVRSDGTAARTSAASWSSDTLPSPRTLTSDVLPSRSNHACASANVITVTVAPPIEETSPNLRMPETVTGCRPVSVDSWSCSPTEMSSSSAWSSSTATWPDCAGIAPSCTVNAVMSGGVDGEDERRGAVGRRAQLVVAAHQEALRLDLRCDRLHAGQALDGVGHGLVERHVAEGAVVGREARLLADDDADLLVARLEDVREGRVDLVGQHERAGDHRDAEQDGDRRQGRAELAGRGTRGR